VFLSARDVWWGFVIVLLLLGGLKSERSNGIPVSLAMQPWRYGDLLLIFALLAATGRLDLIPAIAGLPVLANTAAVLIWPAGIVLSALWLLLHARYHVSFRVLGFGGPHRCYYAAWSFMVVGACLSLVALVATFFVWIARPGASLLGLPGPPDSASPLRGYLHQSSADLTLSLVIVAYVAVLGPLFEEIIFRGLFLGPVVRRFGVPIAAIASAALWSLGHSWTPAKMIVTFCVGLAFAQIYVRTGSLLPSLVLHVSGNGFGVILPVFLGLTRWETLLLPVAVLAITLCILARGFVRRMAPGEAAFRLAWSEASVIQASRSLLGRSRR